MKKKLLVFLSVISLLSFGLLITEDLSADTSVGVSVTMPEGTIGTSINKVVGTEWTPESSIVFNNLQELTDTSGKKLGVFGPSDGHYYAIDFFVKDGGYPSSVSVTINFDNYELGHKMTGTFAHVVYVGPTDKDTTETPFLGPQALATSTTLTQADFIGYWTRMYVGIAVPPDPYATPPQPPLPGDVTPWTATDAAGGFSGTLNIYGAAAPI